MEIGIFKNTPGNRWYRCIGTPTKGENELEYLQNNIHSLQQGDVYVDSKGVTWIKVGSGFVEAPIEPIQSYTPEATNLGEVTTHTCYKKNGICEYKLIAKCGTWTANVGYIIGTLDPLFRPTATFVKEVRLNDQFFGYVGISAFSGNIFIIPRITISNSLISIDETFISV